MAAVLVLGNFVVDLIGKPLDRLPEPGRLLLLDTMETHLGGNGPNTAGALARLGGDVAVGGRVGEDVHGRFLVDQLTEWGVETAVVVRDAERPTGMTLVAVNSAGERSFLHHYGANAAFGPDDVAWDHPVLGGLRHLHLASHFVLPAMDGVPAASLLREARRRGLTTSLDTAWDFEERWMEVLKPCLPHVDWFTPSHEEAARLSGRDDPAEQAAVFRDLGAREVVIKLGEQGCYAAGSWGELRLPAYDVPVRDTTGAGDCFVAGLLYQRLSGADWEAALRFANACGGLSVSAVGGVSALRPAPAVREWMRSATEK